MSRLQVLTAPEQVAKYLEAQLRQGRWRRVMPGEDRLIAEFGIGRHTVKAALSLLEKEGWLQNGGPGKPRRIVSAKQGDHRRLRVRIFLYEPMGRGRADMNDLLARLQGEGFAADYASKSLRELGMDARRVARFVGQHPADAWVVCAGSREVLEWFAGQPFASLAMYGRFSGLPIAAASPRHSPPMVQAVEQLVDLGHRRIVMLTNAERRKPSPALFEQNFLDTLKAHGLSVGAYNLPDWEESPVGLQRCLDSLFEHTPPTALLPTDAELLIATQQYLARHRILVPEQVSLVCTSTDPVLAWCHPAITHIQWDYRPVVRRVLRWLHNVAMRKPDRRQTLCKSRLVKGGTIAPAPEID